MPNKVFIICYDPEGFTSSIPSVTPIEISCHCQLNLEYGSCDWLGRDFKLNVWNMTQEFVHFIPICRVYEPSCFVQFPLIQVVQFDAVLLQPVDNILLQVAKLCDRTVLVGQFSYVGALSELTHNMSTWPQSLVKNFAPVKRCFHQRRVVALHCNLKHGPQQTSCVLDNVCHIRYQAES